MKILSSLIKSIPLASIHLLSAAAPGQGNGWDFGEGAVVLDEGGVRFRVYAPGASTVAVAGEFNSWSMTANPMVRDAEGYYSTTVMSARAGQEYKYVVNGSLWRKDPWSFQVDGTGEAANSVIVDLTAYDWQATDWQTPRIEELIIYQLHLKGFQYNGDGLNYSPGRVIRDFIDTKLDYLTDLGVNAIHVMPVAEFPGEDSWGYNPVFFHAIESSYGSPQDFQRLVDECHRRGIAVILDIVQNHTDGRDNTHYWDFDGTADNEYGGNGQFYYDDERALTLWGPEPNYGHPRTKARLLENARLFAELYRVDGFRMDAVGFIRGESNDGDDWHGWQVDEGWQYLRDFNNIVRGYQGGRFLSIAEDIASNPSITQNTSEGGAGFLAQWAETDLREVMASPNDNDRGVGEIRQILGDYYPVNYGLHELVKYHSSHDKVGALNDGPRLPVLIGDPSAQNTRRRSMLANALVTFSPGTPLFFMGDEKYAVRSFAEQAGQGLDWSLRERNRGFYEFSRDLFALKRTSAALHQNNLEIPATNDAENLITWRRWGNSGEVIVLVANFSATDRDWTVPFPSNGTWHEVINSDWSHYEGSQQDNRRQFQVSDNASPVRIPAYSIIAYGRTAELAPGRVWDVTPADGSFTSGSKVTLEWQPTSRADQYAIYVGDDPEAVLAAGAGSPEYRGTTSGTSHQLEELAEGQPVFWRVDSINAVGTTSSDIFQFTHGSEGWGGTGRVRWTPAAPVAGRTVTVTYEPKGGVLEGLHPVTAHRGFTIGGTDWQNVQGLQMQRNGAGNYTVTVQVPPSAEAIDLVFNHQASTWDNNGGSDWKILVQPAGSTMFILY